MMMATMMVMMMKMMGEQGAEGKDSINQGGKGATDGRTAGIIGMNPCWL